MKLISTKGAAEMLDIHVKTLCRYVKEKKIPAVKIANNEFKFRTEDLERFIEERMTIQPV